MIRHLDRLSWIIQANLLTSTSYLESDLRSPQVPCRAAYSQSQGQGQGHHRGHSSASYAWVYKHTGGPVRGGPGDGGEGEGLCWN